MTTWKSQLFVEDLQVVCIIGDLPHERINPQSLRMDLQVQLDPNKTILTDNLETSVDYVSLAELATHIALHGQFRLVEALAEAVISQILNKWPQIESATIKVIKSGCIENAQRAGILVTASR